MKTRDVVAFSQLHEGSSMKYCFANGTRRAVLSFRVAARAGAATEN